MAKRLGLCTECGARRFDDPTKTNWYYLSRWPTWGRVGLVAAGLLVVGGMAAAAIFGPSEDEPEKSGRKLTICEVLRDPENNSLGLSDLMRLADMEDWEIQRIVRANCPEQYDRVD